MLGECSAKCGSRGRRTGRHQWRGFPPRRCRCERRPESSLAWRPSGPSVVSFRPILSSPSCAHVPGTFRSHRQGLCSGPILRRRYHGHRVQKAGDSQRWRRSQPDGPLCQSDQGGLDSRPGRLAPSRRRCGRGSTPNLAARWHW